MAIETKEQLKNYFQTGDKPTQQHFANLIDSLTDAPQVEQIVNTAISTLSGPVISGSGFVGEPLT